MATEIVSIRFKRKASYPVPTMLAPGEPAVIESNPDGKAEFYVGNSAGVPKLIAGGSGTTGIQGTTGVAGLRGATGLMGSQGQTGVQGVQGVPGSNGVGSQGQTGVQGLRGLTGVQGTTGIQGVTGPPGGGTGLQGTQGATGLQGAQGIQGQTGVQGVQGVPGTNGVGSQGATGIQGVQGIQGQTGVQGIQGQTGVQGIQGQTGIQGLQGAPGITGLRGTTGVQGVQGNPGATGPQPPVGGSNGQAQYVNAGSLAGTPALTLDGSTVNVNSINTGGPSVLFAVDNTLGTQVNGFIQPCGTPFGVIGGFGAGGRLSGSTTDPYHEYASGGISSWTLYYTPCVSNYLTLWHSALSQWVPCKIPNSLTHLNTLTSGVPNDIFAWISSWTGPGGPVMSMVPVSWATTTTRQSSSGIARQDGIWAMLGQKWYRYLGTVFPNSSDSPTSRTIWNADNQVPRRVEYTYAAGSYSTWAVSAPSAPSRRHYGGVVPQKAVELCVGVNGTLCNFTASANIQPASGGVPYFGIGLDQPASNPSPVDGTSTFPAFPNFSGINHMTATGPTSLGAGYHWLSLIEGALGTGNQQAWTSLVKLTGWVMG